MATRERSALYPGADWNTCLDFVRTVSSFNLKAVSYGEVAKKYGLSNPAAKSFTQKVSSCKQYGLISTSGGNTIQITETCKRLLYPTGEDLRAVEVSCFSLPPLYSKLIAAYDGKALPSVEILANILMSSYGIQKSAKGNAAQAFLESAAQLGLIRGGILYYSDIGENPEPVKTCEEKPAEEDRVPSLSQTEQTVATPAEADYISQSIPFASGKVARFIIPVDATEDDLLLLRDMFDVLLRRKFKVKLE